MNEEQTQNIVLVNMPEVTDKSTEVTLTEEEIANGVFLDSKGYKRRKTESGTTVFAPGNKGRQYDAAPQKVSLVRMLRKEVAKEIQMTDGSKMLKGEEIMKKLVSMSINGDVTAMKLIMSYLEGMPVQQVNVDVDHTVQYELGDSIIKLTNILKHGKTIDTKNE